MCQVWGWEPSRVRAALTMASLLSAPCTSARRRNVTSCSAVQMPPFLQRLRNPARNAESYVRTRVCGPPTA
jgi:hypothetical protein